MLIESLYTLDIFINDPGKVTATITVNASHRIFEGHFPGQPVLPGVCQLQIVKELLEKATGKKLFLKEAANCKFLQMIDPVQTNLLTIAIDHSTNSENITCHAVFKSGERVFFKMSGLLNIV